MFVGIMFLMKYHKKDYQTIYNLITATKNIQSIDYYNSIKTIEYHLIGEHHNIFQSTLSYFTNSNNIT